MLLWFVYPSNLIVLYTCAQFSWSGLLTHIFRKVDEIGGFVGWIIHYFVRFCSLSNGQNKLLLYTSIKVCDKAIVVDYQLLVIIKGFNNIMSLFSPKSIQSGKHIKK